MFLGKQLKHKVFIKFVPENLETRGLQYTQHSVMEDVHSFSTKECAPGGLHFTWLKHAAKWSQGSRVFLVTIPDDALVCLYDDKGKASKLVLTEEIPFQDLGFRAKIVRYLLKRMDRPDPCYLLRLPFEELKKMEDEVRLSFEVSVKLASRGLDHLKAFEMNLEELKLCEQKIDACDQALKKRNIPYSESFGLTLEQLKLYHILKFLGDFSAIEQARTKNELIKKAYHPSGRSKVDLATLPDDELKVLVLKKEAYLSIKGIMWADIKDLSVEQVQELLSDFKRKEPLIKKIADVAREFSILPGSILEDNRLRGCDVSVLEQIVSNLPLLRHLNSIKKCTFFKYVFLSSQELERGILERKLRMSFWSQFRDDKVRLREMSLPHLKTFEERSEDIKTILPYVPPGMTLEKVIEMSSEEFEACVKSLIPFGSDPLDVYLRSRLVITDRESDAVGTTELWELYCSNGPKPRVDRSAFLKRCSKYLNRESYRKTIDGKRLQSFVGVKFAD